MTGYIMAIDQGTTSSRAIVFDHAATVVASAQLEHRQILPRAGWVEHDPLEIWSNVRESPLAGLAEYHATKPPTFGAGCAARMPTHTPVPLESASVSSNTRASTIPTAATGSAVVTGSAGVEYGTA